MPHKTRTTSTKPSKKIRTEADNDKPTAHLPLYLQRLLKQLEKAAEQESRLASETPVSFDLLQAASRVSASEIHLRREHLGEQKWKIFTEESERAIKDALSDEQGNNPYGNVRGYVRNARLPPLPWCWEASKAELAKGAKVSSVKGTAGGKSGCGLWLKGLILTLDSYEGSTNTFTTAGTFAQPKKGGQTTERKPDCVRKLRRIEKIPYEEFRSRVQEFSETLPVGFQPAPRGTVSMQPGFWDGDKWHADDYLSLKADGFKVRDHFVKAPATEKRVADWIEEFPAMTAARVLHVCDPETLGWAYQPVHGEKTMGMLSDLCWQRIPPGNSEVKEETIRRLVLEVKAPWVLDLELFNTFVTTSKIPTSDQIRKAKTVEPSAADVDRTTIQDNSRDETSQPIKQPSISFSKVENIWAQIYDYCVAQGNFFFVLTTYDYWVFGVFSADYTGAQVTDPLAYDSSEPNILECLLYWTQSARLVPGMFEIPWPLTSDIGTADERRVAMVEICIKNTALHLRRIFQDAQNRARKTPPSNTKIKSKDKIKPKPAPPYAVACRFAASLGQDFAQIMNQDEYQEKWKGYFKDGILLKSDSQQLCEEDVDLLDTVVRDWDALEEEKFLETYGDNLDLIHDMLQHESRGTLPSTGGMHARRQLFHGSVSASHGPNHHSIGVGRPRAVSRMEATSQMDVDVSPYLSKLHLGVAGVSTSPNTPCSPLSAPSSSPSRFRGRPSSTSASSAYDAMIDIAGPSYHAGSNARLSGSKRNRRRDSSGSDGEGSPMPKEKRPRN